MGVRSKLVAHRWVWKGSADTSAQLQPQPCPSLSQVVAEMLPPGGFYCCAPPLGELFLIAALFTYLCLWTERVGGIHLTKGLWHSHERTFQERENTINTRFIQTYKTIVLSLHPSM